MLKAIAGSNTDEWKNEYGTGLDFAEGVYRALGADVNLPSVEEIIENLFTPTYFEKIIAITEYYADAETPIVMYVPQDEVDEKYKTVQDMLVDRYFGGYRLFATDIEKFKEVGLQNFDIPTELGKVIIEFKFDYLEAGDILVFTTAEDRSETGLTSALSEYKILIYTGEESFISINSDGEGTVYSGEDAEKILEASFKRTNDLFFLLRPSEAVELNNN